MEFPIVLGAGLGTLFVLVASRGSRIGAAELLAAGLAVAALIYVVLALAGADRSWLSLEGMGLILFGVLAWLGARVSSWWLAFGWAAHAAWDSGLHLDRPQVFVSAWYPLLCVGFDLIVAGFALGLTLMGQASAGQRSQGSQCT